MFLLSTVRSLVVRFALGDNEPTGSPGTFQFVDKAVGIVDATAPIAIPAPQRFRLAKTDVAVALNVLDEKVDAPERLFVLLLP